jgi:hypothetical protein
MLAHMQNMGFGVENLKNNDILLDIRSLIQQSVEESINLIHLRINMKKLVLFLITTTSAFMLYLKYKAISDHPYDIDMYE